MLGKNQIYCGDAFDLLSKVEDESVDLIRPFLNLKSKIVW